MAYVGIPAEQIAGMRQAPFWSGLEALAPTLAYDHAGIMGAEDSIPYARAGLVDVPALVMHGSAGAPFMGVTARALTAAMPHAELRTLEGQRHDVSPDALAPVLREFFAS
jgi:pimeloyl-ACP methyl ester carboxylesterase